MRWRRLICRMHVAVFWFMLLGNLGAAELSDFTTSRFSGAGNCAFCHDPWSPGDGNSGAVLTTDWRATMMAHSFKDPLWRAVMEAEVAENHGLKSFIENKCQTCHAPLARTQASADGTNELAFRTALTSPLAGEGVGCTLCHQIQPSGLGNHSSFTGHYQVGTNREIFGPYEDVLTMPMRRHVDYTPVHGAHVQDSAFCATCHTLFTPILNQKGEITGEFPEQVPYLEWRNSDYAREGRHCQDCHMPRSDAPVKVSSRPPWLEPRAPFWKHEFVGGNSLMLGLLAGNSRALQPNADPDLLRSTIAKTKAQLRRAASLHLSGERKGQNLAIRVEVENLTGHKFPTGHPYRRAWIHLLVKDARGRPLFESGTMDKTGAIVGLQEGYTPHRDIITRPEEVQVYQSIMADQNGESTWSLLRGASYLKDNRIPPKGFKPSEADVSQVRVCGGAETDSNFNAGANGRDQVTYQIHLADAGALTVEVELLYQSVPPESVQRLLHSNATSAKSFAKLYQRQKSLPELVSRATLKL